LRLITAADHLSWVSGGDICSFVSSSDDCRRVVFTDLPVCLFRVHTEAVVQFDYAAREPDELTLKNGDIITDVKPMPDGWMEGHKDGKKGMFPDTYVKVSTTLTIRRL